MMHALSIMFWLLVWVVVIMGIWTTIKESK